MKMDTPIENFGECNLKGLVFDEEEHAMRSVDIDIEPACIGTASPTDENGVFTRRVAKPPAGSPEIKYTVSPRQAGMKFNPTDRQVKVLPDSPAEITMDEDDKPISFTGSADAIDPTARGECNLKGCVKEGDTGLDGVTVTAVRETFSDSDTTDSNGDFKILVPVPLQGDYSYTVTPSHTHYTFKPTKVSVSVNKNHDSQDVDAFKDNNSYDNFSATKQNSPTLPWWVFLLIGVLLGAGLGYWVATSLNP